MKDGGIKEFESWRQFDGLMASGAYLNFSIYVYVEECLSLYNVYTYLANDRNPQNARPPASPYKSILFVSRCSRLFLLYASPFFFYFISLFFISFFSLFFFYFSRFFETSLAFKLSDLRCIIACITPVVNPYGAYMYKLFVQGA